MPCITVSPPMSKASGIDTGTAAKGLSHSTHLGERETYLRAVQSTDPTFSTLTWSEEELTLGEAVCQQQRELMNG